MKRWTIYCHTHISTGRRYIGLTQYTMLHRWNQHCVQAKNVKSNRSHFANAIRKYGKDAFEHEVLAQSWDLESANATEEQIIEQEGTRDPRFGFNLMKGGSHVPHLIRKNPWDDPGFRKKATEAARKRATDPAWRAKILAASATRIGMKLSPEHCLAISKASIGRKLTTDHIKNSVEKKKERFQSDPSIRERFSAIVIKRWNDPSYRAAVTKSIRRNAAATDGLKLRKYDDTHKICAIHGKVLLSDCYAKIQKRTRKKNMIYECKFCVRTYQNARYNAKCKEKQKLDLC